MYRCIDPDINRWLELANVRFKINKIPTRDIYIDETTIVSRRRRNPRFVFISRKPYLYGNKMEPAVDADHFFIKIHHHK